MYYMHFIKPFTFICARLATSIIYFYCLVPFWTVRHERVNQSDTDVQRGSVAQSQCKLLVGIGSWGRGAAGGREPLGRGDLPRPAASLAPPVGQDHQGVLPRQQARRPPPPTRGACSSRVLAPFTTHPLPTYSASLYVSLEERLESSLYCVHLSDFVDALYTTIRRCWCRWFNSYFRWILLFVICSTIRWKIQRFFVSNHYWLELWKIVKFLKILLTTKFTYLK